MLGTLIGSILARDLPLQEAHSLYPANAKFLDFFHVYIANKTSITNYFNSSIP